MLNEWEVHSYTTIPSLQLILDWTTIIGLYENRCQKQYDILTILRKRFVIHASTLMCATHHFIMALIWNGHRSKSLLRSMCPMQLLIWIKHLQLSGIWFDLAWLQKRIPRQYVLKKIIGLHSQNWITILGLIVNMVGGDLHDNLMSIKI